MQHLWYSSISKRTTFLTLPHCRDKILVMCLDFSNNSMQPHINKWDVSLFSVPHDGNMYTEMDKQYTSQRQSQ